MALRPVVFNSNTRIEFNSGTAGTSLIYLYGEVFPPTVTTTTVTNITHTGATSGGNVTSQGTTAVTVRGIQWSLYSNFSSIAGTTTNGSGTGTYTSYMTNLTPTTTYYVRAYATNSIGTGYGNTVSFTSSDSPIVVCLDGLVIETLYIHTVEDMGRLPLGYVHPYPNAIGAHTCNSAYYEVFGNNIYMGSSRLNNANGTGGGLSTNSGYYTCQDYDNVPTFGTGWNSYTRYDKTTLNKSQAIAIAAAGSGGNTISLSYLYKGLSYGGNCGNAHSDVNWLRVSAPDGKVIWNSTVTGSDINVFDVCTFTSPSCVVSVGLLKYDSSSSTTACSNTSTATYYGNANNFLKTGKLYSNDNCPNPTVASAGYYSDGSKWRYWNGTDFTTIGCCTPPTVTTTTATNITNNSATTGGNVTTGTCSVGSKGICWNSTGTPVVSDNKYNAAYGAGSFTYTITGLTANVTYYARAFAYDDLGNITYGNEISFKPFNCTSLSGWIVKDTTSSASWCSNQVKVAYLLRGTSSDIYTTALLFKGSDCTTYGDAGYYGIYGNPNWRYWNGTSFTSSGTCSCAPSVTTNSVTEVGSTTATCGGYATSNGCNITARGVCWNTSGTPTISDTHTNDGVGDGAYTSYISGLTVSVTYYVRAYVTNVFGVTSYGSQQSFTTGAGGYYDCGYGCQYYSYDPGCPSCYPGAITLTINNWNNDSSNNWIISDVQVNGTSLSNQSGFPVSKGSYGFGDIVNYDASGNVITVYFSSYATVTSSISFADSCSVAKCNNISSQYSTTFTDVCIGSDLTLSLTFGGSCI